MTLYPGLAVAVGHDDNITAVPTDEVESTFYRFVPRLSLVGDGNKVLFDLTYEGDITQYSDSGQDDYDDHQLLGVADLALSNRMNLRLEADYADGHDARGALDTPDTDSPNEYEQVGGWAILGYGASGASGRVEVEVGQFDKTYDNNRGVTAALDRAETNLRGTFFWRVGGRTEALVEGVFTDVDYELATSTQDSDESTYNVGLQWEATGRTVSSVRVGYTEKDFSSPAVEDDEVFGWAADIAWSPRTYSTVTLSTSRSFEESTGQGDSVDTTTIDLGWSHGWSERFSTSSRVGLNSSDYTGETREDDTLRLGLGIKYQFLDWLGTGLTWEYDDKDSNENVNDYERNTYMFEVSGRF